MELEINPGDSLEKVLEVFSKDSKVDMSKLYDMLKVAGIALSYAIDVDEIIEDSDPILIGHLNKSFGYNFYYPAEIGTQVFEHKGQYFFDIIAIDENIPNRRVRFYKETLTPAIKFLDKKEEDEIEMY